MVQPGQVLRFDLSDTSAAQLGGRAIAAESGGRIARDLAAQRHHLDRNDAQLQQDIAQQFAAGVNSARLAAKPLAEQIPGGPARFTVASDRAQTEGIVGQLLDNLDRFNNSPLGMALQGLPPEGLAIGGIRAGLTWIGRADKVVDSLQVEGRLTGRGNVVNGASGRNIVQHTQYLEELQGLQRADYLKELADNGIKHNPANIVDIRRTLRGQLAFLETGTPDAGLAHVMNHAGDFAKRGVHADQIAELVMTAVERGKVVGYQGRGTGRPIYEVIYNDTLHQIAVTMSNNGFIVGANPARIK
jgi:hypothetical protein